MDQAIIAVIWTILTVCKYKSFLGTSELKNDITSLKNHQSTESNTAEVQKKSEEESKVNENEAK